jgi:hypothetical protein
MKAEYFVDVCSHWCLVAVPAVQALRDLGVDVEVVYAPLADGKPLGFTNEMESWFYKRGSGAYGKTLHPDWCEGPDTSTWHANVSAYVAGEITGDQLAAAHAMMSAAMERGVLVGRAEEAHSVAAAYANAPLEEIERRVSAAGIHDKLTAGNKRLEAVGADERPTFVLTNDNGDRVVFKGVWQRDAIVAAAEALLHDEKAYKVAGPSPY